MSDLIAELHALAQRMAAAGETDEPVTVSLAAEEIERLRTANLDSVAVCEQALQAKAVAEQERDQLKAILQDVNTSDYRFSVEQLSVHDAELIQRFKKSALETAGLSAGCVQLAAPEEVHRTWVQFADHYIDQLHQQAQEVQP